MYVGSTDTDGLHHLIWELVGNAIDQHLARKTTELRVDVNDAWCTIRDDGPGIPVEYVQDMFTSLRHRATYDGHFPHVHIGEGFVGLGCGVVGALSTSVEVETTREGVRWAQSFERGVPVTPLQSLGASTIEGTLVRFHPDPQIFGDHAFDAATIEHRLQQLAWLNPLLRIFFQERRLMWRGGVRGWASMLAGEALAVYSTTQSYEGVDVDVGIAWSEAGEPRIHSFVNMHETRSGKHVDGIWLGLADCVAKLGGVVATVDDVRSALGPGLNAVVHVGLFGPEWAGPRREHLESPIAAEAVRRAIGHDLPAALQRAGKKAHLFLQQRFGIR